MGIEHRTYEYENEQTLNDMYDPQEEYSNERESSPHLRLSTPFLNSVIMQCLLLDRLRHCACMQ
jgi:hypothetical protein